LGQGEERRGEYLTKIIRVSIELPPQGHRSEKSTQRRVEKSFKKRKKTAQGKGTVKECYLI